MQVKPMLMMVQNHCTKVIKTVTLKTEIGTRYFSLLPAPVNHTIIPLVNLARNYCSSCNATKLDMGQTAA